MRILLSLVVLIVLAWPAPAGAQVTTPVVAGTADPAPPAAGPRLQPGEPMPVAELEAFIDATVQLGMDQAHVAGVAVAVVQGGTVVLKKGYGFASFDPMRRVDPDTTLFRIGSITKTFTWIAAMRAVEAGTLDLDAPINTYLPAALAIPDEGFTQPIRLRDLMMHAPGFEDHVLGILFADDPARIRPLEEFLRAERPRRVREPGTLSSYSNYGTALAGAAVAHVEGLPWQDVIERDILNPLGLAHISVREPYPARAGLPAPMPESLARELSRPFRWSGATHTPRAFEYITQVAPAGVMSASAGDMATYMRALLRDGTLDEVTIFGPVAAQAFRTPMTTLPREAGGFAAGFFESALPGGFRSYGHDGGTLSFFTNMTLVPELDLGIFVATNTEGGGQISGPLPARVIERFYAPRRDVPAPPGLDPADAARVYAGAYRATRRAYHGLEGFVGRLQTLTVGVSPEGYLQVPPLFGGQPQNMVPAGEPGVFRPADGSPGLLVFELDGERARRIVLAPIAFDRVSTFGQPRTLLIAAALTLLASLGRVAGVFRRRGRAGSASPGQRRAGLVHFAAAVLWIATAVAAAIWATGVSDVTTIVYDWPGALRIASSTALAASLLTLTGVALLPAVWSGRRDQWSGWRKVRYTGTMLFFATLALWLATAGALQPWDA